MSSELIGDLTGNLIGQEDDLRIEPEADRVY
jgi:hypothetical protein